MLLYYGKSWRMGGRAGTWVGTGGRKKEGHGHSDNRSARRAAWLLDRSAAVAATRCCCCAVPMSVRRSVPFVRSSSPSDNHRRTACRLLIGVFRRCAGGAGHRIITHPSALPQPPVFNAVTARLDSGAAPGARSSGCLFDPLSESLR